MAIVGPVLAYDVMTGEVILVVVFSLSKCIAVRSQVDRSISLDSWTYLLSCSSAVIGQAWLNYLGTNMVDAIPALRGL
jgi:hypothetical protein